MTPLVTALLFLTIALAEAESLPTNVVDGRVVALIDGDTLNVTDGTAITQVRLKGIDAPEGGQSFSYSAMKALEDKVIGRVVHVEWQERDRQGRVVGHVFVRDRWINEELVREGWAWHFKENSESAALAAAEKLARANKAGLWAGDPPATPPWEYPATATVSEVLQAAHELPSGVFEPDSRGPPASRSHQWGDKPTGSPEKTVYVRGYTRKDGTYVRPHYRRPPRR